jgi:hypothetical protein
VTPNNKAPPLTNDADIENSSSEMVLANMSPAVNNSISSKIARNVNLFAAIAVVALALLILPNSAPAAECAAGKSGVTVNGKQKCVKVAALAADEKRFTASNELTRLITQVSATPKYSKVKLTRKQRRLVPAVTRAAQKLLTKSSSVKLKPKQLRTKHSGRMAGIAAAGPVVQQGTVTGQTIKVGEATVTSTGEIREYEDGTRDVSVTIDATVDGYTLRYIPHVDVNDKMFPDAGCPTAEGLVTIDDTDTSGVTMMVLKGKGVLAAITESSTRTIHARGHVGRDARLHDVEADVTTKDKHYERGLQIESEFSGTLTMQREGDAVPNGALAAKIKIRAAGLSTAEDRLAEQMVAERALAGPNVAKSLGSAVGLARWEMLRDEYKWYDVPNSCATIQYDPNSTAKIKHGQSRQVKGHVIAGNGGGQAHSSFTVNGVSRGQFSVVKAEGDPGAPALFTAVGASQNDETQTVASDVIATSTAGRASEGFYADDDVIDLPETFTGTVSATTSTGGTSITFSGTATYTKQSVFVSPQGFVSAWYEVTSASLTDATHEIGVGCRWVAKGTGGSPADGDIELRREPGGEFKYALLYDTEIEPATFVPTDCPPNSGINPFSGSIVGFLNTHAVGAEFRPVGPNFKLAATGATDVIGAAGVSTTASWDFTANE